MDLLAALSVTTDLGMGQPPETALRSSLLATRLARAMELPVDDVRSACLGTLLRHVGCTATASVEVRLYGGDELVSRRMVDRRAADVAQDVLACPVVPHTRHPPSS